MVLLYIISSSNSAQVCRLNVYNIYYNTLTVSICSKPDRGEAALQHTYSPCAQIFAKYTVNVC